MSFKKFYNEEKLNEATVLGITVKRPTPADRKKGEVYVVFDKTTKKVVISDNGKEIADNLKRDSAKEIAATNKNYEVASATFAHDQGMFK